MRRASSCRTASDAASRASPTSRTESSSSQRSSHEIQVGTPSSAQLLLGAVVELERRGHVAAAGGHEAAVVARVRDADAVAELGVQALGLAQVLLRRPRVAAVGVEHAAVHVQARLPEPVSLGLQHRQRSAEVAEGLVEAPEPLQDQRPLHAQPRGVQRAEVRPRAIGLRERVLRARRGRRA